MILLDNPRTLSRPFISVEQRLTAHLRAWIGAWPPSSTRQVFFWPGHDHPGWDGGTVSGMGVTSPRGTVLSVSPRVITGSGAIILAHIETALDVSGTAISPIRIAETPWVISTFAFRWSDRPANLPDAGEWVPADAPGLPGWLRAFSDDVLVTWDGDRIAAGVGIKRHNRYGHEIAVGTEPGYEGHGFARRLVSQAARRILVEGAVPLYFHLPDNTASARVAEAAGFPDRGWQGLSLYPSN